MTNRTYTWKPDLPDHRDHTFTAAAPTFPSKVDRLGMSNPIEDQGDLGSCTGNSSTSMVEIILNTPPLSRLMAYYDGRLLENNVRNDDGAQIRDVIKGISKYGISTEVLWPYVIAKFKNKPTKKAYADGLKLTAKIGSYQRVPDLVSMKKALAAGHPVTFGFSVPEYFEGDEMATKAFLPFPSKTDKMVGGHAVVAVGYDDTAAVPFIWVRNSWGASWGLQGYFMMDQKWFTDSSRLADDMWTIIPK